MRCVRRDSGKVDAVIWSFLDGWFAENRLKTRALFLESELHDKQARRLPQHFRPKLGENTRPIGLWA